MRDVRQALGGLKAQLAKERQDVIRLEGGFAGFLARLAGSKEDKLARERAEVEVAWERLDGEQNRLEQLIADLQDSDREIAEIGDAHYRYARLLAEKERLLVVADDPRRDELVELTKLLIDADADIREHDEARQSGIAAGHALDEVLRSLGSARTASTWDLFGGGFLADSIERKHLLRADQAAWHAQRALDVFARELVDVGVAASPRLPTVDTRWFVDTFFDNIITDAFKHDRIARTRAGVVEVAAWVGRTVGAIVHRGADLARHRDALLAKREELISG